MAGVVRTRVGYSGGTKKEPTYHDLGDHSETLQLDFDPARISYEKLLDVFWKAHEPTARSWSRQYRAAVFFENENQKKIALETCYREAFRIRGEIFTEILPASVFYQAEDYHQKYYLQLDRLLIKEFQRIYPHFKDVVNSTAAARVNGYLGGHGTVEKTEDDLALLGLSPEAHKRLLKIAASRH
jgi:peptide-methionine (S)-S-oxide reductase